MLNIRFFSVTKEMSNLNNILNISFLFITSFLSIVSLGYGETNSFYIKVFYLTTILFVARYSLLCVIAVILFLIPTFLLAPAGIASGPINEGVILSIILTTKQESFEYIKSVPVEYFLISAYLFLYSIYYFYLSSKEIITKRAIISFIIFTLMVSPFELFNKQFILYWKTWQDVLITKEYKNIKINPLGDWVINENKHIKNTIVVVIGESVRKDYMSSFGYQMNTTPWLNRQNGVFFRNYISTAAFTILSLPRTLALSNDNGFDIKNNVVNLANKSGYDTYWISNQGSIGINDSLVTLIASTAKYKYFTQRLSFDSSNVDDIELLPKLDSALMNKKDKVIFIHMMGSHENACMRLFSFKNIYGNFYNKQTSCYLASLSKLDSYLKTIREKLDETQEKYSMVYFSDHCVSVDEKTDAIVHTSKIKESFDVPLIIMSDHDKEKIINNDYISARNFMTLFSQLIGVKAKNISEHIDSSMNDNVLVFDGNNEVRHSTLRSQPAIKPMVNIVSK